MEQSKAPEKTSVFLLILYYILTLGIYSGIWYIKKAKELNSLKTQKKIKSSQPIILTVLISLVTLSFLINYILLDAILKIGPNGILDLVMVLSFLISIYYFIKIAFRTREIINQALFNKHIDKEISKFFTLIYNYFYLQYEINRIIEDKEEKRRVAPWLIFYSVIGLFLALLIYIAVA